MVRIRHLRTAPAAEVEAVGIAAEGVVDIAAEAGAAAAVDIPAEEEAVVGTAVAMVAAGPTGTRLKSIP